MTCAGEPVTVLVVDDDPELRAALQLALQLDGYRVETAPDGARALDALPGLRPDLVVLDLMMPYPDGLEVCRRLRSAGNVPQSWS